MQRPPCSQERLSALPNLVMFQRLPSYPDLVEQAGSSQVLEKEMVERAKLAPQIKKEIAISATQMPIIRRGVMS